VAVSEDWVAGSRNFCNKLWNAVRFAQLNGAVTGQGVPPASELTAPDRWILSRLAAVTAEVDALFEQFEFAKVCDALYHFAWDEVCDWYLELAKPVLTGSGPDEAAAQATRRVLGEVLDRLLRLIHPLLPFVTEELWTALTGGESVVIARWPGQTTEGAAGALPALPADPAAEAEISALMRLVTEVRRFRSDQGLRPSQRVPARLADLGDTMLSQHEGRIRTLLRLAEPGADFTPTASLHAEGATIELDTAVGLDVAAERKRLTKDLAAAQADIEAVERKLSSASFVERAPAEVVAKNRDRLAAAQGEVARLTERLAALPADAAPTGTA
jgi:valyl-tRNA synthetase